LENLTLGIRTFGVHEVGNVRRRWDGNHLAPRILCRHHTNEKAASMFATNSKNTHTLYSGHNCKGVAGNGATPRPF